MFKEFYSDFNDTSCCNSVSTGFDGSRQCSSSSSQPVQESGENGTGTGGYDDDVMIRPEKAFFLFYEADKDLGDPDYSRFLQKNELI